MTVDDDGFTDRERELAAVTGLLAAGSRQRVLAVHGVSGLGKSAFLRHVLMRSPQEYPKFLMDVQDLVDGFAFLPEAGEDLALALLQGMGMALAACAPWWRRRRVRRLAARIGGRPGSSGAVRVRVGQVALWNSVITASPVTAGRDDETPAVPRRPAWVDELVAVAAAVRRRRCLLLVDSTEWLYYFDDVRREQPRAGEPLGTGTWFTATVLARVLEAAPRLKVVLAGQDRLALGSLPAWAAGTCELGAWEERHTAAYLARSGLAGEDLARLVHQESAGLPLLAWLLAQACQDGQQGGGPVGAAWLAAQARDRPLREWLPAHVLGRLSEEQQDLVQACAVLRTITQAAVEALASTATLSPGWSDALARHYLLEEIPAPGQARRWRMHTVVRTWLLDHLDRLDADRIPDRRILLAYHQRAARYYAQLNEGRLTPETAYHAFASGDPGPAPLWRAMMVGALHAENFDQALVLAAATDIPRIAQMLPGVHAAAAHARAWVAYQQGRLEEAARYAASARGSYSAADDPPGHARLLQLEGQIAWQQWDWQLAAASWQQALDLPGGLTTAADRLVTSIAAAEATLRCGQPTAAEHHIATARRLLAAISDVSGTHPSDGMDGMPAFSMASAVPASLRDAYLLRMSGEAVLMRGDWGTAAELLAQADAAAQASGDPHLRADVLRLRGTLATDRRELTKAGGFLDAALNAARTCPDESCRVGVLTAAGSLLARKAISGTPPQAGTVPVLPTVTASSLTTSIVSLDRQAQSRHERQLAAELSTAALGLSKQIGDRYGEARARLGAGGTAWLRGEYGEASQQFSQALALYEQIGDRYGEAGARLGVGEAAWLRGEYGEASQQYSLALSLSQGINDRYGEAEARRGLGQTANNRGEYGEAIQQYSLALALCKEIDDQRGEADTRRQLGETYRLSSDFDQADQQFAQVLGFYQEVGDLRGEVRTRWGIGDTARMRGNLNQADLQYSLVLALSQEIEDSRGEAHTRWSMADVARTRGDYEKASQYFSQALALFQQIGEPQGEIKARLGLGEIAMIRGDYDRANQYLLQALAQSQRTGDRQGEAEVRRSFGYFAGIRGDHGEADRQYSRALAMFKQIGTRRGEALVLWSLGQTAQIRGDYSEAIQQLSQALALFKQVGSLHGAAGACESIAEAARLLGSPGDYQSYLSQAADLYETCGLAHRADDIRQRLASLDDQSS